MDDEHEVLDWGNEEDELPSASHSDRHFHAKASFDADPKRSREADDVEDAVSLGGDEDDIQDFFPYESRASQNGASAGGAARSSSYRVEAGRRDADSDPVSPRKEATSQVQSPISQSSPRPSRSQHPQMLKHALPAKPVVSTFLPLPSTTAASPMSMARLRDKDRRTNGNGTKSTEDPLPPGWEARTSRGASREVYYYNVDTHDSTWTHPGTGGGASPLPRARAASRGERDVHHRDEEPPRRILGQSLNGPKANGAELPKVDSSDSLTYDDRHYRPGDPSGQTKVTNSGRDDRLTMRVSQSSNARVSPESVERVPRGRDEFRYASSNSANLRDREPSVPSRDRDSRSRRISDKDDYRSSAYDDVDTRSDYGREASRNMPRHVDDVFERSRRPEAAFSHSASYSHDAHRQERSLERSSTLRRRSPSPRSIHRSPPRNRQVDRGYPSPQSEAPPPLPLTRPPPRQSRASSPPPRPRASDATRRHDPYAPNDDLPQRRVRERTSAEFDSDHDVKRRRTDVRSGDSAPARRAPMETDGYIPRETSTTSTSPRSMINQADQNHARKRLPLPPQRDRYREMATVPSVSPPVPGLPAASARTSQHTAPQPSAPSGPRHALPPAPQRENAPPHDYGSGYRQSETGYGAAGNNYRHESGYGYPEEAMGRDRDAMDIDPPYPSRGTHFDEPVRQYDRALPRGNRDLEPAPRAPRAMGRMGLASEPQAYPEQRLPPPESAPRRPRDRTPPPTAREPSRRPADGPSAGATAMHSAPYVDSAQHLRTGTGARRDEPSHRFGRDQFGPASNDTRINANPNQDRNRPQESPLGPAPRLSGTNSVPIGARKGPLPGDPYSPPDRSERRGVYPEFAGPDNGERSRDSEQEPRLGIPMLTPHEYTRLVEPVLPPRGERRLPPPPSSPPRTRRQSFAGAPLDRPTRFGPPIRQIETDPPPEHDRRWIPRQPSLERNHTADNNRHATTLAFGRLPPRASPEIERRDDRRPALPKEDAWVPPPLEEQVSRMRVAHGKDEDELRAPPRRARSISPGTRSGHPYDDRRLDRHAPPPPVHRDREPPARREDTSPYLRTPAPPEERIPASWDRPRSPEETRASQERPPPPPRADAGSPAPPPSVRASKPVRIRRPPPRDAASETFQRPMPPPADELRVPSPVLERPRPVQRVSLLDRLSDKSPQPSGSLRDRVVDDQRDQEGYNARDDDVDSGADAPKGRKRKQRGRRH